MLIDVDQVLYSLHGNFFEDGDKNPYTLRKCLMNVLLNAPAETQAKEIDEEYKMNRYMLTINLAMKKNPKVEISAEQISMVKKLALSLHTDLYGAVVFALEGKPFPLGKQPLPSKKIKNSPEEIESEEKPIRKH